MGAPDKATMTFAVPGDVSTANNSIGATSGHSSSWYPVGTKMVYSKGSATDPLNGFVHGNTYYVQADMGDSYKLRFTTAATNSGSGAVISIGTISSDEHASDHTFTVQTPTATASLVSNQYSGLFRDASDDKWKFFKGLEASPTGSAVDITGTGYAADTVVAHLEGNVTGNVSGSSGSTTGNAATATKLSSNRTFTIQGEVTGNVNSDLTSGFTIDNSAVGSNTIDADNLKVTGNGSAGNVLYSDGDGTFSWGQSLRTTDSPTFGTVTADLTGTATKASTVRVIENSGNALFYPTFVDSNNTSEDWEYLYLKNNITFNPSSGTLSVTGPIVAKNDGAPYFQLSDTGTSANSYNIVSDSGVFKINKASDSTNYFNITNGNTQVTGDLSVLGNVTLGNTTSDTVTIAGNLQVDGTTTTINSTTLDVDALIISVGKG